MTGGQDYDADHVSFMHENHLLSYDMGSPPAPLQAVAGRKHDHQDNVTNHGHLLFWSGHTIAFFIFIFSKIINYLIITI